MQPNDRPSSDATPFVLPPEPTTMPPVGGGATGADYSGNTSELAAAVQPLSHAGPPLGRWTAGTLTYTTGGLVLLFVFLLFGDFALSMRDRSSIQMLQLGITRLHASDLLMSLLVMIMPAATSLIVVPVISYRSDRTRTRWGRRIPWLFALTPVAAGCMFALAFADWMGFHIGSALHLSFRGGEFCGLMLIGLFWTVFECTATNPSPLMGGLINDVVPRPVLGRFYGLFRAISLGAGMLFNKVIFGTADEHYRTIWVGIGLLFLVGFTVMCLTVREGQYPPPPPTDPDATGVGRGATAVKGYLSDSFRHGYYIWIFAGLTLSALAFLPFNSFSLPFAQQYRMSNQSYGDRLFWTYVCSLVLAWPVGWLVDRASALVVAMGCVVCYAAVMLFAALTIHGATSYGVALVIHGVLSGCYYTSSASLGQALFPRDKYGQFFSAAGMVQALATIVMSPLLGSALDWSNHNYRITLYLGCLLAVAATSCLLVVYFSKPPAEDAPAPYGVPVEPVPHGH